VQTFSNIRGIIFDLGYTLIDYKETGWPEIRKEAIHRGYSILKSENPDLPEFDKFVVMFNTAKEKYRRRAFDSMFGWNIIDVVNELFEKLEIKDISQSSQCFVETIYLIEQKQKIIDKNISKTLDTLKVRNYKMGIISNTIYPAYLHENDLKRFGWDKYFDFQIYSSECKFRKPHKSIFENGIKKMNLQTEKIIYVGDRYKIDALGAQKVGLVPIIKYCKKQTYPEIWPENISIVQSISELPNRLNHLEKSKNLIV